MSGGEVNAAPRDIGLCGEAHALGGEGDVLLETTIQPASSLLSLIGLVSRSLLPLPFPALTATGLFGFTCKSQTRRAKPGIKMSSTEGRQ